MGVSTKPSLPKPCRRVCLSPGERTATDTEQQLKHLFRALYDADCRRILEVITGEALSAREIADICELSQSTAYRKLDLLVQGDLLEERIRVNPRGHHESEYVLQADGVFVSIGDETGVQASLYRGSDTGSHSRPEDRKRDRADC